MTARDVFRSIAVDLDRVEAEINRQPALILRGLDESYPHYAHLKQATGYLFRNAGKRLRPALVLLAARIAAPEGRQPDGRELGGALVALATAVELIHSASLIHDDIIDQEQLRRGQQALHRRHSSHSAVLVGDILYARAFSLLSHMSLPEARRVQIFQILSQTTQKMCFGEIAEQRALLAPAPPAYEAYLDILRNKTAELMASCCRTGAVATHAAPEVVEALSAFGMDFGLAFQLLDDYGDKDARVDPAVDIIERAEEHMSRSRAALSGFPDSAAKAELLAICDFLLARARVEA